MELLTAGGPMRAASYAAERGLTVTALVPDIGRFLTPAAVDRRDTELVLLADAAVIVRDRRDPRTRKLWALVAAKGCRFTSSGEAPRAKAKKVADQEDNPTRGLPD
jgi:hypothetical protein